MKTEILKNWKLELQYTSLQWQLFCLSFSQVKWKITVKNFVFVNENQFTWRSSQNYTLSYYQLTFSESNRLYCFKDLCLVIHKSNFNNYKIRAAWSRTTEPQAAHRMKPSARETLIWLESVTEKVTGSAQTGACVDVFSRCSPDHKICLLFTENSSLVPRPVRAILVTRESLEPTS